MGDLQICFVKEFPNEISLFLSKCQLVIETFVRARLPDFNQYTANAFFVSL